MVKLLSLLSIPCMLLSFACQQGSSPDLQNDTMPTAARQIVMKDIPAGTFLMGSNASTAYSYEKPVHQVTLNAFSIQETEVTQEQYEIVMGINPSHFKHYLGKTHLPVEQVTWYDAALFCNALSKKESRDTVYRYLSITGTPGNGITLLDSLVIDYSRNGYRLPTEAEWEYACRAGTTTLYWWGDDENGKDVTSWCYGNSHYATQPVATKTKNTFGLYDMTGNVWEWCNDWFAYYDSVGTIESNPTGPDTSSKNGKIIRGGSWYVGNGYELKSSFRNENTPGNPAYFIGFRVVLSK